MLSYLTTIAIQIGVYLLLTLGLNLHYGFTGLINFGHVAFYCIGAYTVATVAGSGVTLPLAMILAMALAAGASLIIGALTLRLRAEFLAILTLGFGETVRLLALNEAWLTNGPAGHFAYQPFVVPGNPGARDAAFFAMVAVIAAVVVFAIQRLVSGPFGRLMRAIRDSEESVRAIGKVPVAVKLRVLMIGAALAGLAGALQAQYIGYVSPDQFTADVTFLCWMAMIIGGTGRIGGSLLGSIVLFGMFEGTRFLNGLIPGVSDVQIAQMRVAAIGLMLILFTRYLPGGIIREKT